jgi:uncharacterized protein
MPQIPVITIFTKPRLLAFVLGNLFVGLWPAEVIAGPWDSIRVDPLITIRAYLADAEAQNSLGRLYFRGVGVPQSYSEALLWWQSAAEQGDADAQTNLGALYDQGLGVTVDKATAMMWWNKAAAQGNIAAQINLRAMADIDGGLPADDSAAVAWYRRAAFQGDQLAQYMLGRRYAIGRGAAEDPVMAYAWNHIAATQGNKLAVDNIKQAEAPLTLAQVDEAMAKAGILMKQIQPSDSLPD